MKGRDPIWKLLNVVSNVTCECHMLISMPEIYHTRLFFVLLFLYKWGGEYSGRNFALLEFCEMRDLELKISRNSRNSQGIELWIYFLAGKDCM